MYASEKLRKEAAMSTQPLIPPQQSRARLATAAPPLFNINDFLQTLSPAAQPVRRPCQNAPTRANPPPFRKFNKTNPTTFPRPIFLLHSALKTQPSKLPPPPARAKLCQTAPTRSIKPAICAKRTHRALPTNSKRPPRPLTANQILAATLLVAGRSTTAIATELKINRHTLARWKRSIKFQNELRFQINARLAQQRPRPSTPAN
jgi:hypothetical protein